MQAALCVLFATLCVHGVSTSPLRSVQTGANLASVDDVNILMYGVLQFTESLHHMYQSTEARLARVMKAISRTENEVQRLGNDTQEAAQTEQQIKEKLQLIQDQMKALQNQVEENRGTITRVELEEAELKRKLSTLEKDLNSSIPDTLKGVTRKNISILKDLMKWTREQKLKLENQTRQLAELQKQNMV